MNRYLCMACAVLVVACASLLSINNNLRQEKNRLSGNQDALMEGVRFYKTDAGKSAASVRRLELTKSELEKYNQELTKVVESLNIKLRRVQAATRTATQTNVELRTVIKDSVVYVDSGRFEKLSGIKWRDPWINVEGLIRRDSTVELSIQSIDTLYQVVHRVPKKFLFIKYGTKAIRQEITSSNPHTQIVYSEYIELIGRKKK